MSSSLSGAPCASSSTPQRSEPLFGMDSCAIVFRAPGRPFRGYAKWTEDFGEARTLVSFRIYHAAKQWGHGATVLASFARHGRSVIPAKVGTRMGQACPDYARSGGQPAAPPPAVRKGFAFPGRVCPEQLPPRRPEGSAFRPTRRGKKEAAWAGKPEAFCTAGGGAALSAGFRKGSLSQMTRAGTNQAEHGPPAAMPSKRARRVSSETTSKLGTTRSARVP